MFFVCMEQRATGPKMVQKLCVCVHPVVGLDINLPLNFIFLFLNVVFFSFPDEKTLYLTPEQEKDKSHFTDKEVSTRKLKSQS